METTAFNIDELRQQYSLLQQKVESQQIINDRLLRESMSRKQSWSRDCVYLELFVGLPFLALFLGGMVVHNAVSIWPVITFIPLVIADVALDYRMNVLSRDAFSRGNLMQTARRMVKYQKITRLQTVIGTPLSVLWAVWFIVEMLGHEGSPLDYDNLIGGVIGGCIGLVVGVIVVYYVVRRILRDRQEIIDQIKVMEEGEAE